MGRLTHSENIAYQLIKKDPNFFVSNNLSALAKKYNIGDATLVRLVKKLGFNSLKQMQISFASEIQAIALNNFELDGSLESINNYVANFEIFSILETKHLIDLNTVNDVAQKIASCKYVSFFGIENSWIVAEFLVNSLQRIGFNPSLHGSVHGALVKMPFMMQKESIIIIFSDSGITRECVELANQCLRNKIEFVWIGSKDNQNVNSPLQNANYKLFHTHHQNETLRFPSISSYSGQLYIANLLFNTILNFDSNTLEILKDSNALVKSWNQEN